MAETPLQQNYLQDWPTLEEAADILRMSVRTLRRKHDEGKLELRQRQRKGIKSATVANPVDIENLKPQPYVLKTEDQRPDPARVINIDKPERSDREAMIDAFIASISSYFRSRIAAPEQSIATIAPAKKEAVPIDRKLWLSIPEAAAYSGYAESQIRKAIEAETVKATRGGPHRSWIIKRDSLEAL